MSALQVVSHDPTYDSRSKYLGDIVGKLNTFKMRLRLTCNNIKQDLTSQVEQLFATLITESKMKVGDDGVLTKSTKTGALCLGCGKFVKYPVVLTLIWLFEQFLSKKSGFVYFCDLNFVAENLKTLPSDKIQDLSHNHTLTLDREIKDSPLGDFVDLFKHTKREYFSYPLPQSKFVCLNESKELKLVFHDKQPLSFITIYFKKGHNLLVVLSTEKDTTTLSEFLTRLKIGHENIILGSVHEISITSLNQGECAHLMDLLMKANQVEDSAQIKVREFILTPKINKEHSMHGSPSGSRVNSTHRTKSPNTHNGVSSPHRTRSSHTLHSEPHTGISSPQRSTPHSETHAGISSQRTKSPR